MSSLYSTHLPVLKSIPKIFKIERVLEFGCGYFSTLEFLKKDYFPDLNYLLSLESVEEWGAKIVSEIDDDRLEMIIASELELLDIAVKYGKFDLALIDGDTAEYRVPSFEKALQVCDILVAHDTENSYWDPIRDTSGFFKYQYTKLTPNTSLFIKDTVDHNLVQSLFLEIQNV